MRLRVNHHAESDGLGAQYPERMSFLGLATSGIFLLHSAVLFQGRDV